MEIIIKIEDCDAKKLENKKGDMDDGRMSVSCYARFFNSSCPAWANDSEYNMIYLKQIEKQANYMLKARGYLFLNDVYEMLGLPRSKAGQVVGWIYSEKNPIGDNHVDFDIYADANQDFVNGLTPDAILDFNVDGCILDVL